MSVFMCMHVCVFVAIYVSIQSNSRLHEHSINSVMGLNKTPHMFKNSKI